jgi:hypothetical protein
MMTNNSQTNTSLVIHIRVVNTYYLWGQNAPPLKEYYN